LLISTNDPHASIYISTNDPHVSIYINKWSPCIYLYQQMIPIYLFISTIASQVSTFHYFNFKGARKKNVDQMKRKQLQLCWKLLKKSTFQHEPTLVGHQCEVIIVHLKSETQRNLSGKGSVSLMTDRITLSNRFRTNIQYHNTIVNLRASKWFLFDFSLQVKQVRALWFTMGKLIINHQFFIY